MYPMVTIPFFAYKGKTQRAFILVLPLLASTKAYVSSLHASISLELTQVRMPEWLFKKIYASWYTALGCTTQQLVNKIIYEYNLQRCLGGKASPIIDTVLVPSDEEGVFGFELRETELGANNALAQFETDCPIVSKMLKEQEEREKKQKVKALLDSYEAAQKECKEKLERDKLISELHWMITSRLRPYLRPSEYTCLSKNIPIALRGEDISTITRRYNIVKTKFNNGRAITALLFEGFCWDCTAIGHKWCNDLCAAIEIEIEAQR